MKKRTIIICAILPFLAGFIISSGHGRSISQETMFHINNILPTDKILLSNNGDIYQLTSGNNKQITHNQNLIEPVSVKDNIAAIEKKTNYSSMILYNQSGDKVKTFFNGNSASIDAMSWATDPAVAPGGDRIAYVSDKDKDQTQVPDNALYLLNLSDGKSANIANPAGFSGGIAHPVFNPANSNILLYDYYQYDPETYLPYSSIEEYNKETGVITTLTFENKNAYQETFSPDGKQLIFLGRNNDANTATLYLADFASNSLSNMRALATGDLAYPTFSNTQNHIYYLKANVNSGYDLYTSTIEKNKLTNMLNITTGSQLSGNSSYSVVKQ